MEVLASPLVTILVGLVGFFVGVRYQQWSVGVTLADRVALVKEEINTLLHEGQTRMMDLNDAGDCYTAVSPAQILIREA